MVIYIFSKSISRQNQTSYEREDRLTESKVEESSTESSSSSDEDEDAIFGSKKEVDGKHGKVAHIGVEIPDEEQLNIRRNSTC